MTDRELLEAAAKAAGIEVLYCSDGFRLSQKGVATHKWDPLNSDADAFRLAVKLKITSHIDDNLTHAESMAGFATEAHYDDPYAATRRAIVRAAAQLGKEKNHA